MLESMGTTGSVGRVIVFFFVQLVVGTIVAAIGGVLGAVFFRKDVPPASAALDSSAAAAVNLEAESRVAEATGEPLVQADDLSAISARSPSPRLQYSDRRSWLTRPHPSNSSDLLQEDRRFPPSDAFRAAADGQRRRRLRARRARPRGLLGGVREELEWFTPWTQVLEWKPPHAKWFVGGTLNASVNCVDRHVRGPRRNKAAIIWEGEPGDRRTLTYFDLYRQVSQFANVLKSLGVKKGDRVAIYLPLVPELAIAMLACARIGAVHSVVFGGFSSESLRDRINDAQATLLVTADGGWRRGQVVPLKQMADVALEGTPSIRNVVIVQRLHGSPVPVHVKEGRDHWYHRLMQDASLRVRARAHGRRGHALHPLHVGHDGQAEGHRPHDRRLPGRHLRHHQVGVRPQGGRRLLVHGRHRLGDRAQLRRLRAAGQRRDGGDVRGRARLAAEGSLLGDRRALRRHDLLHGADRHPRVHEVGHRLAREARPVVAAPARLGGRADQPRSVGLVSPVHRRRALSGGRHVVADRDGRHHDHAAARHHRPPSRARPRGRSPASRRRSRPTRATRSRAPAAACWRSRGRGRRCCAASTAIPSAT